MKYLSTFSLHGILDVCYTGVKKYGLTKKGMLYVGLTGRVKKYMCLSGKNIMEQNQTKWRFITSTKTKEIGTLKIFYFSQSQTTKKSMLDGLKRIMSGIKNHALDVVNYFFLVNFTKETQLIPHQLSVRCVTWIQKKLLVSSLKRERFVNFVTGRLLLEH